jgi:hypothetical protein
LHSAPNGELGGTRYSMIWTAPGFSASMMHAGRADDPGSQVGAEPDR